MLQPTKLTPFRLQLPTTNSPLASDSTMPLPTGLKLTTLSSNSSAVITASPTTDFSATPLTTSITPQTGDCKLLCRKLMLVPPVPKIISMLNHGCTPMKTSPAQLSQAPKPDLQTVNISLVHTFSVATPVRKALMKMAPPDWHQSR